METTEAGVADAVDSDEYDEVDDALHEADERKLELGTPEPDDATRRGGQREREQRANTTTLSSFNQPKVERKTERVQRLERMRERINTMWRKIKDGRRQVHTCFCVGCARPLLNPMAWCACAGKRGTEPINTTPLLPPPPPPPPTCTRTRAHTRTQTQTQPPPPHPFGLPARHGFEASRHPHPCHSCPLCLKSRGETRLGVALTFSMWLRGAGLPAMCSKSSRPSRRPTRRMPKQSRNLQESFKVVLASCENTCTCCATATRFCAHPSHARACACCNVGGTGAKDKGPRCATVQCAAWHVWGTVSCRKGQGHHS